MITFRYINKNEQPHSISFTLLIEDEDGDEFSETIRIEKTFKVDSRVIDKEFLRTEAYKEINRILHELENPIEIPPEIVQIEEIPNGNFGE